MADPDHLKMLQQGVDAWNVWRERNPDMTPDLQRAELGSARLKGANLTGADLRHAYLNHADLRGAHLSGAWLDRAELRSAYLSKADFSGAHLFGAFLNGADLHRANLTGADLSRASLGNANLTEAIISRADLSYASLVEADITGADLTGCRVYGVSAWGLELSDKTRQQNLIITRKDDTGKDKAGITVDNIEVAQFVYLLLHNEKIRDVIDTVGKKGVLLLGRFTEGRIAVLDRLRAELRQRGYLPIVFNFDKPETRDFTETVRLLAGLSHFVIADVTKPKSAPLELQATVPEIMVPFRPIIEEGEKPFAMLEDLWRRHRDWVFEPLHYSSTDNLIKALDQEIIGPAEAMFDKLVHMKAETMKGKHV